MGTVSTNFDASTPLNNAAIAAQIADIGPQINAGSVGYRNFYGRYSTVANPAAGDTYHMQVEVPIEFDSVCLVMANINTADVSMLQAAVTTTPDTTTICAEGQTDARYAAWPYPYFKTGASTVAQISNTLVATRPTFLISDPIGCSSKPRTDGSPGAILHIRAFTRSNADTTGSYTVCGNGTTDTWVDQGTGIQGFRIWCRVLAGQKLSTWTSLTTANSAASQVFPITGIIYLARGKVVNVTRFGDSIMDGRGTQVGDGWLRPACAELNARQTGIVYECGNSAWSGSAAAQSQSIASDILYGYTRPSDAIVYSPRFPVDIAFTNAGSPNDTSGTIDTAEIAVIKSSLAKAFGISLSINARPIIVPVTMCPSNPTTGSPAGTHDWGATDSLRRALNEETVARRDKGIHVLDLSARASGDADATGQINFAAGMTTDGTHPSDACNALIKADAVAIIERICAV